MIKLTNTTKTFTVLVGHDRSKYHIRFEDNSKYAGKSLSIEYCYWSGITYFYTKSVELLLYDKDRNVNVLTKIDEDTKNEMLDYIIAESKLRGVEYRKFSISDCDRRIAETMGWKI